MEQLLQKLVKCSDAVPNFLGIIDTTVAPTLLFYSYIPIFIVSMAFGLFVYRNSPRDNLHKLLFSITTSFSIWILLIIFQWVAVHANIVHFAWQSLLVFEFLIYTLAILFSYELIYKKSLPNIIKNLLFITTLSVTLVLPTKFNIYGFNITDCEGIIGVIWNIQYIFEAISIIIILAFAFDVWRRKRYPVISQEILISIGMSTFLSIFFLSNFFGEITKTYNINLIGPIGMVLLLITISYSIVRYKTFRIKLLGTQVLVTVLWIALCAILFIGTIENVRIVVSITLILFLIVGAMLVRSVKREVTQREKIENLAKDLEKANDKLRELDQMKSEFLSLATHQIRSPLTAIKGYSSMMLEGDYGEFPVKARDAVRTIMTSSQNLINIVGEFLDISRIEQGRMIYNKEVFDMKELVNEVANELMPNVKKAGLDLKINISENIHAKVNLDKSKMKQIISNLIDNGIKYTLKGSITVELVNFGNKIIVKIKDTGIGIEEKDLDKLFTKFTRTKEAFKTNVTGTGLGLYIAKKMLEAQGGSLKVESEGLGKGSIFTIEIPRSL